MKPTYPLLLAHKSSPIYLYPMALKTFVKISKVNNLSDARYCAGMGVDLMGFSLQKEHPSFVDPTLFSEITQWIAGPQLVGEFGCLDIEDIKLASVDYALDYIETDSINHLESLSLLGKPMILKIDYPDLIGDTINQSLEYVWDMVAFVICTIKADDFTLFSQKVSDIYHSKILLDIVPIGSTSDIISQSSFLGYEMTATPEEKTGFKDYGAIMDILEVLEVD